MMGFTRFAVLFVLNLTLVLGIMGANLITEAQLKEIQTRMDYIGIVNKKVFVCDKATNVQEASAQTYCQELNGTVAVIEVVEENNIIRDYMGTNGVGYFWLDLTDYGHEGEWKWASTGQSLTGYNNWAVSDEPKIDKSRNCATISAAGFWNVARCSQPDGDSTFIVKALCQLLLA